MPAGASRVLAELGRRGVDADRVPRGRRHRPRSCRYQLGIETVPTLLRVEAATRSSAPSAGSRRSGRRSPASPASAPELPDHRPGCGSRTLDPDVADELARARSAARLPSRAASSWPTLEDEIEAMFDRGWTDGLPVVPPTEARVLRMLEGTTRAPDEVVAVVPPDLVECTVEKVAVNAVHGGLQARVPAGRARRGRGGVHRRVQHARPARHDVLLRAGRRSSTGPIAGASA